MILAFLAPKKVTIGRSNRLDLYFTQANAFGLSFLLATMRTGSLAMRMVTFFCPIIKHLRISAKVLYYLLCQSVILFHELFLNCAIAILHEVYTLNRCGQSLTIYSITSCFFNFGSCYRVVNASSGIELYNIFKITKF